MGVFYSVTDLAKLEWMGDKQIHRFLMTWRLMLDQMQTIPPPEELTEILMQKMERSVVLKEDIGHFCRMEEDGPDRDSGFLVRAMGNYLDRERYRTNRANDLQAIMSQTQARAGAPSVLDAPAGNTSSETSERRKKKKAAKVAAAKAAAAPAPTPKGKGKGKGPGKEKKVCYYFNQPSGCPRTAEECWFLHKKLSTTEVAKMVQPVSRAASRANSPAGGGSAPKAKASPKAKGAGGKGNPSYVLLQVCEAGRL